MLPWVRGNMLPAAGLVDPSAGHIILMTTVALRHRGKTAKIILRTVPTEIMVER